jgi:hypothetical protein
MSQFRFLVSKNVRRLRKDDLPDSRPTGHTPTDRAVKNHFLFIRIRGR